MLGMGLYFTKDSAEATPLTQRAIEQISQDEFDGYIKERTQVMVALTQGDVKTVVPSRISFKSYMKPEVMKNLSEQHSLKVQQLYFGWGSNRGGYTVTPGQTFDQAIAAAKKAHLEFFRAVQRGEQRPELTASFQEYKRASDEYGLPLYAIDVEARVQDLQALLGNSAVRFVDVDSQKRSNFIVPLAPSDFAQ